MDVDNNSVGAHAFCEMKVSRAHGHWLVKGIRVGKIEKLDFSEEVAAGRSLPIRLPLTD